MFIDVMSDLHLEFNPDNFNVATLFEKGGPRSHTLVIAGDICPLCTKYSGEARVEEFFDVAKKLYPHIVYVLGNHDYWYCRMDQAAERFSRISGIKPLDGSSIVIDGVTFAGGTLWTNVAGRDFQQMVEAYMNDYRFTKVAASGSVRSEIRKMTVADTNSMHARHLSAIKAALNGASKLVVVSHHPPIRQALPKGVASDPVRLKAYAGNCNRMIRSHANLLAWVYGHAHAAKPFEYGDVKMICNPRGYFLYESQASDWKLRTFEV